MTCTTNEDCSNSGICNETCKCFKNYTGAHCELCISDNFQMTNGGFCLKKCEKTCDPYYKCQYESEYKENLCICEVDNANPDENCISCISGFQLTNKNGCQHSNCVQGKLLCGDVGECVATDGIFSCQCQQNFTGTFCENCSNNMIKTVDDQCLPEQCVNFRSEECSGLGKCDQVKQECICDHSYAGSLCQKCDIGFILVKDHYGSTCESEICFVDKQEKPCSNNGICVTEGRESFCQCEINASGPQCQDCLPGYKNLDNGFCLPEICSVNGMECADNGYCEESENGFYCSCIEHYSEPDSCANCVSGFVELENYCVSEQCVDEGKECNTHGYCLDSDVVNEIFTCVCEKGYRGKFCQECLDGFESVDDKRCAKPECVVNGRECGNNGKCIERFEGNWKCNCDEGASGAKCDRCFRDYIASENGRCVFENCYSDKTECGGHGYCQNSNFYHQCVCDEGYSLPSRCVTCEKGYVKNSGVCVVDGDKISSGAIAGIVVAILVLIIILSVCIVLGIKCKRRNTKKNDHSTAHLI